VLGPELRGELLDVACEPNGLAKAFRKKAALLEGERVATREGLIMWCGAAL
jgi:hypothetical protein